MNIPLERFGYDHWATFGDVLNQVNEDGVAIPNPAQMRCDIDRHPGMARCRPHEVYDTKYPTTLRGGVQIQDHDDWDCVDDLEAAGFVEQLGTGINPVVKLTELGLKVAAALRAHKAGGGRCATFSVGVGVVVAKGLRW